MTFDVAGGALDDVTCRQGSPNLYPHLENPRPVAGFINERIGEEIKEILTMVKDFLDYLRSTGKHHNKQVVRHIILLLVIVEQVIM